MPMVNTFRMVLHLLDAGTEIKLRLQLPLIVGRTDPHSTFIPDVDLEHHGGHDAGVSRRHVLLIPDGKGLLVKDLGSANGTFINDLELKPEIPYPLLSGVILRLGYLEVRVDYQIAGHSGELTALMRHHTMHRMTASLAQMQEQPTLIAPEPVTPEKRLARNQHSGQLVVHQRYQQSSLNNLTAEQRKAVNLLTELIVNRDLSDRMKAVIAAEATESRDWRDNPRLAVLEASSKYGYVARDNAELLKAQRRVNKQRFNYSD